jgi:AraC family transcriptional regulator
MLRPESARAESQAARLSGAWEHVRIERHPAGVWRVPEHEHDEHLAVVPLGAACEGELKASGGFRAARCGAGGAAVIPAGQPHSASSDGPARYASLYLDPALVLRAASDSGVRGRVEVVAKSSESDPTVQGVALALLAEAERGGLCGPLYTESLANVLAVHLLRNYSEAQAGGPRFGGGLSGRRLRRVTEHMAENHERDLSLTELARVAGVSPFHFAREFKRATGAAPHQYLIRVRVERAKALLAEGRLPLAEISLRAGFSSQSHFTRLFHRLTGETPKSYREMLRR